jgi:predicted dehydrogenase
VGPVTVRVGCLGAAKIAPNALVKPARKVGGVAVTAIAARDRRRAQQFADTHGIPNVHATYDDLVEDPDVDAVYIPLPNGLHAEWMRKALEHGKHVLCEKPFTSNAHEAEAIRELAEGQHPDLVVMEAFHWRYHPLAQRMVDIVQGGELGEVRHLDASFCFPLFPRHDIRWQLDLAGGALMDAGCYAIHMVRHMAGATGDNEPTVTHAEAKLRSPGVDRWIRADLRWPDGRTGRVTASMWSANVLRLSAGARGDRGTMRVLNPLAPHLFNRLKVTGRRAERVGGDSTYAFQLRAFVDAVTDGAPTAVLTPPSDSVANMRVIDAVYRAAGLEPRAS